MEDNEKYGIELEAITSTFKSQIKDLVNTTKEAGQQIKDNLNVKDSINFKELENKANSYKMKIKQLTEELSKFQYKQRVAEWGGKSDAFNQEIDTIKNKIEILGTSVDKVNSKKIELLGLEETEVYIDKLRDKLNELKNKKQELEKKSIWEVDTHEIDYLNEEIRQTNVELEIAKSQFNKLENLSLNQPINQIEEANEELTTFERLIQEIQNNFSGLGQKISKGFKDTIKNIKRTTLAMIGVHSAYRILSRAVSTYSQYDIETTNKMKSAWAGLGAFLAPIVQTIGTLVQKAVGYLNVFITALTGTNYIKKANDAYKYSKSIKAIGSSAKEASKSLTAMDEITNLQEESTSGGGSGLDDFNPFEALENVELNDEWVKKMQKLGETLAPVYKTIKNALKGVWEYIKNMDEEDWKGLATDILAIGTAFLTWKISPKLAIVLFTLIEALGEIKKYSDKLEKGKEKLEDLGAVLSKIGIFIASLTLIFGGWVLAVIGGVVTIEGIIMSNLDAIQGAVSKTYDILGDDWEDFCERGFEALRGLYNAFKQVFDGIVGLFNGTAGSGEKIFKGLVNILIFVVNNYINAVNTILTPLRKVMTSIAQVFNKNVSLKNVKIPSIPYLDEGTAYVKEDGLAMIHKGEAVIPKKFNSQEYFSNMGNNDTTNQLLIELIQAVEENGDKVPVFNINGKEFAKATYNDYKDEANRLNNNNIVRRV